MLRRATTALVDSMLRTRRQTAQAVVELAIAMPILLWFALGTLDFGRVFYVYIELTNAAREGARQATLRAPACDVAPIRTLLAAQEPDLLGGPNSSLVTLTCPPGPPDDRRTVTIDNYPFAPVTPFIGQMFGAPCPGPSPCTRHILLRASATMPVLNQ
jgi:TadE-like protein